MKEVDEILMRCTGVDIANITPEKHLVIDLMADSIALIDIAIELESAFGFVFTEHDMQSVNTVADIYDLVTTRSSSGE
ncbi:phosphopantetheine-binding protein [Serratia silvae]|uniref:Acyl carrier protein n=1 Tax=Serratia silvae TaxID=2824122 RepID=A0ABT0KB78_9GAMM|nr:phosphopantetheine-binding protein [Serratia silvae]MCL1028783.1 acyl carrier protein [Serratia silvae]